MVLYPTAEGGYWDMRINSYNKLDIMVSFWTIFLIVNLYLISSSWLSGSRRKAVNESTPSCKLSGKKEAVKTPRRKYYLGSCHYHSCNYSFGRAADDFQISRWVSAVFRNAWYMKI